MTLSRRWTRDLTPMRRLMNRFFDEDLPRFEGWPLTAITTPDIPLDILDRDDELVVKASLPGLKPADLHVEVDDDSLRIWGEVKEEHQQEEGNYYLREHRYGRIERMTSLLVVIEPRALALAAAVAIVAACGGALYPAACAARRDPVEAMAHE